MADLLDEARVVTGKELQVVVALFARATTEPTALVHELLREALLAGARCFLLSTAMDVEKMPLLDGPEPGEEAEPDAGYRAVTTLLDPREPGRALLEGILEGVQASFEVYLEEIADAEVPDPDPRLTGPQWTEEIRQRFDTEVRDVVALTRQAQRTDDTGGTPAGAA